MDRLGVQGVALNEHEVMIASHLVDPNHLKISWKDVAGLDEVIESIKRTVIYPILAQQKNIKVSRLVQPPKGTNNKMIDYNQTWDIYVFIGEPKSCSHTLYNQWS